MNKKFIFLLFWLVFVSGCAHVQKDYVFQNALFSVFESGSYNGTMTLDELKDHGNFGIGTVNALDGEMIVLDGDFYQVKADGKVYLLRKQVQSPFAEVNFFEPDQIFFPGWNLDYAALCDYIDKFTGSKDKFYAIKVQGKFKSVKVRSVPAQTQPYPTLKEALMNQKIFNYDDIEGTLVGFRFPQYMDKLNVPGYHLHFLSQDKSRGGHLLDCRINDVSIEVDELSKYTLEVAK